jgi:DNA polymerase
VRTIGRRAVRLYPIYHPAAALYTPAMLETLRADFARIPALLAEPPPRQPEPVQVPEVDIEELVVEVVPPDDAAEGVEQREPEAAQLGLF